MVFELKNDVIADDIASVAAVNVFDGLEAMDLDNAGEWNTVINFIILCYQ